MAAIPEEHNAEWNRLNRKLCSLLQICPCQRKLKSIVMILLSIYNKLIVMKWDELTPEELLICNLLDVNTEWITHGVNCEYPILKRGGELWDFVLSAQYNPALIDN